MKFKHNKIFLKCDVTHVFTPLPPITNCHTFLDSFEPDALYGRPLNSSFVWIYEVNHHIA